MNKQKLFSALIAIALMIGAATLARAQSGADAGGEQTTTAQGSANNGLLDVLNRQKKAIAGSWIVDITVLGLPPECGCANTKNLGTFTEDGGFIGAAPVDTRQSLATPGHGSWTHQGGRTFAMTFLALIYQPNGTVVGIFKLRGTATLDEAGDKLSGPAKGVITDLAGRVLFQYDSTVQGARIKVEPLN